MSGQESSVRSVRKRKEYITEGTDTEEYCTENGPMEIILETEGGGALVIQSEKDLSHSRPSRYPDQAGGYQDITHYSSQSKELDISYQKLKRIDPSHHRVFARLTALYLDHNSLTSLPPPELLPNLQDLDCTSNQILEIPLYPSLQRLVARENCLKSCTNYDASSLTYFDVSYNPGFRFEIHLPHCQYLIATDCQMTTFDLSLVTRIKYLDLSSNRIKRINGQSSLLELAITDNKMTELPETPNLICLFASKNRLTQVPELPHLTTLEISYNLLTHLPSYPSLTRLSADHNMIEKVGSYPRLKEIDLSHNAIPSFTIPDRAVHVSLYYNPLAELEIPTAAQQSLKELKIPFKAYQLVYHQYYESYDSISAVAGRERLHTFMSRLSPPYSEKAVKKMLKRLCEMKFPQRAEGIYRLALETQYEHIRSTTSTTPVLKEMAKTESFKRLVDSLDAIYEKSLVINLYFNGYRH